MKFFVFFNDLKRVKVLIELTEPSLGGNREIADRAV